MARHRHDGPSLGREGLQRSETGAVRSLERFPSFDECASFIAE
jgi:hypothetical protein